MHLFISCPPRLEALLTEELNSLNIEARVWPRGASAPLSIENVYRINMESHLATRVLWPLKSFTCTDRETLYEEALSIEWDQWLTPETTFAVDANVTDNEGFRHSHFAALVVKDAICDYFRDKTGERPSVDLQDPAVQFNLFIFKDKATISFDTSGAPLFKRGYRAASVQAPLQETLAASLLKMSNYTADDILCDPYCGSGTILWEASLMATHTPAGFFRKSWGFFKHPLFSQAAWDAYLLTLEAKRVPLKPFSIFGSDRDLKTVEVCRTTKRATNLAADFQHSDIRFLRLPVIPTLVVTNPPYGVRMQSNTDPYIALARFLETTCQGQAHAAILSPLRKLPGKFPGRFTQPVPIVNGGMDIFVHLLEAGGTSASYARNTQEESPRSEEHSSDADSYTSSSHEDALNDQAEPSDDVQLEQSSAVKEDSLAHESADQSEPSDAQDDSLAHLLDDDSDDDFDIDESDDSDDDESDDDQPAVSKAAPSGNRPARRFGDKSFAPRDRSSNDRPRRPFGDRPERSFNQRDNSSGDRPRRPFGDRPQRSFGQRDSSSGDRPRRPFGDRPERSFGQRDSSSGDRPRRPFGDRPERSFGQRDSSSGDRPRRPFGDRPERSFGQRDSSSGDRPRRPFGDRPERSFGQRDNSSGDRPRRPFGDRPERSFNQRDNSFGDRPRRSFGDKPERSFGQRDNSFGDRPRRSFGDKPERSFGQRDNSFGDRPRRPFGDRPERSFGQRDNSFGDRPCRPFGDRPERSFGQRDNSFGDRPRRPFGDRPERSFNQRDNSSGDRPRRPFGDKPRRQD